MIKKLPSVSAEVEYEENQLPLKVRGKIPDWLSGTLVRNGPVNVTVKGEKNAHWFDGLAMLHAFSMSQGNVCYTNKFLRTDDYKTVFEKGSLSYGGFASDPCRSLFKRFFTFFSSSSSPKLHNTNVNVAKIAEEYVALTEVPLPVRFDPITLETLGVLDYEDELPKDKCWESAHPHRNYETKELVNYLIDYGRMSHYVLYRLVEGSKSREIIGKIPVREPSYMHSFALTEHYLVLTEFPFVVRPLDLITKSQAFIKNFAWEPERGTTFTVINRSTGERVCQYKTKPFFSFHHANAYEKGELLYLDLVTYPDATIMTDLASQETQVTKLERFTLSLKTGEIKAETLLHRSMEFPRINEQFDGLPYQFVYLAEPGDSSEKHASCPLYKLNVETKEVQIWEEEGCFPGEPVFVAAPGGKEEDEGVLLTIVLNKTKGSSFLLVLDGKSFQEIGRAEVEHRIPAGLHSQYFTL